MTTAHDETIVLVEDDKPLARIVAANLKDQGFTVHVEHQGQAAMDYLTDHQPDLVILDVMLPDASGYQIAEQLRDLYGRSGLAILMFTAKAEPKDKFVGFCHGADAYLTKPCTLADLMQSVELLLGQPR